MDPLHIQDMFPKFAVNVSNTRGSSNVLVVPLSHSDHQIPTDIITEQVHSSQDLSTDDITTTSSLQHTPNMNSDLYRPNNSLQIRPRRMDSHLLSSADEGLADLQPEHSDEEEDDGDTSRSSLTEDQQKLEFMAALNLVPPAVMEEIQRRQQLCKAEYGNWWDRLHSTDFCLVPKTDSAFTNIQNENDDDSSSYEFPTIFTAEDQTQVAAGPDAGSLVEQITYLTSWPQSSSSPPVTTTTLPSSTTHDTTNQHPSNTVEIVTQSANRNHHHGNVMSHLHMNQEDALQATLQHITTTFVLPQD